VSSSPSAPQIRSTILALYKLVCMYVCIIRFISIRGSQSTAFVTLQLRGANFSPFRDARQCVILITNRRSVAKRGGCSQRRLFVCQCVSVFVRTITSERLNVGRSNLTVRLYTVQKSHPTSKVKVKGQDHQEQKRKTAESSQ